MQPVRILSIVHLWTLHSIPETIFNLRSLRRKNSHYLAVFVLQGVGVVDPGQVLTDINPEEAEAADFLHCSPINGDGGMSFSLLLPVVHNQLLCFADVENEVVVLAPRCQGFDIFYVTRLIIVSDQAR